MVDYSFRAIALINTMLDAGRRVMNSGLEQSTKLNSNVISLFFDFGNQTEEKIVALNHYKNLNRALKDRKNFASSNNGASILRSSAGVKSSKAILTNSNDAYMHIENCNSHRAEEVIIILSDDV